MVIRICIIFFAGALLSSILARYHVETDLRDMRNAHHQLGAQIEAEQTRIAQLILKIDVLESKQNLTKLARTRTTLRPIEASQLHDFEDFSGFVQLDQKTRKDIRHKNQGPKSHEFINHALAMAGYGS